MDNFTNVLEEIFSVFNEHGHGDYDGEAVTLYEHSTQAAQLAKEAGEPAHIVATALLHDYGDFILRARGKPIIGKTRDSRHEIIGSRFLEKNFIEPVPKLIEMHVAAKRYLATKPEYMNNLSAASLHSLELQGGKMSSDEMRAFENDENFEEAVRLRKYDDGAKKAGVSAPPVEAYIDTLSQCLKKTTT